MRTRRRPRRRNLRESGDARSFYAISSSTPTKNASMLVMRSWDALATITQFALLQMIGICDASFHVIVLQVTSFAN